MSKKLGFVVGVFSLVACSVESGEPTSEVAEPMMKPDCALVLCLQPVCEVGQVLETRPGQCCPVCVDAKPKVRAGDCACSGGYMDESFCGQFGAPWSWKNWACFWPGKGGSGLSAEECASVEAKHHGDGSGSDIYNLGLTCVYGANDCTTSGCPQGQYCSPCRTLDGVANVCLPNGAVC